MHPGSAPELEADPDPDPESDPDPEIKSDPEPEMAKPHPHEEPDPEPDNGSPAGKGDAAVGVCSKITWVMKHYVVVVRCGKRYEALWSSILFGM